MITRRICTSCKIDKPFEEFGNLKKGKWGKREICKDCKRIKDRAYERANPDKMTAKHDRWVKKNYQRVLDYNQKRYEDNPEPQRKGAIEYRKRVANKSVKSYREKYPEKKKAHTYVELAIFFGHLSRPDSCSKCDVPCKPQGHHHDYKKPLDVTWLCTQCHGKEHRKENTDRRKRLSERTPKGEAIV